MFPPSPFDVSGDIYPKWFGRLLCVLSPPTLSSPPLIIPHLDEHRISETAPRIGVSRRSASYGDVIFPSGTTIFFLDP